MSEEEKEAWTGFCQRTGETESKVLRRMIRDISGIPETRPPATGQGARTGKITVRLSEAAYRKLTVRAGQEGCATVTGWTTGAVLAALYREPVLTGKETAALRESNRELAAIGRNLNQVARALNIDFRESEKLEKETIEQLTACLGEHRDRVAGHVRSHLSYISRNGKLEIEDERGDILKGPEAVRALAADWAQEEGRRRKNTRDTTNIVLSMPSGTAPGALKDAVRAFACRQFGKNYQYVMALHTDSGNPHVHLTVKSLGHDCRRLHVRKGDPQLWREGFAAELDRRGVEAEATPRATRGVIRKGISQAIRHMRDRGMTPAVDKARIREIIEDFRDERAGKSLPLRPWEDRIRERQTRVRKAWLTAAKDLNRSESPGDRALVRSIVTFVNDMPPMKTERHILCEQLATRIQARDGPVHDDPEIG